MFYEYSIVEKVRVPPSAIGKDVKKHVAIELRKRYERRYFKQLGIVVSIYDVKPESEGSVVHGDPAVYFNTRAKVLAYIPKQNEVVWVLVKDMVDFGAFVLTGPILGLIHISQMGGEKFTYNKKSQKFVSMKGDKSVKKGDRFVARISTVSLHTNIQNSKVSLTMRSTGLGENKPEEKKNKKGRSKK